MKKNDTCRTNNVCRTWMMIPQKEIDRVFRGSLTASAELDESFLCFEDIYCAVSLVVPKDWKIIDFGCAYAPQAYYFKGYARYIGVDCGINDGVHFQTHNMDFFNMTIQDAVKQAFTAIVKTEKIFAICSAVPDKEARELVKRLFPNHYVWYPGDETDFVFRR